MTFTPTPVPAGELLLRLFTPEDAEQITAVAADPEIVTWNPIKRPVDEWIAGRADWSDGTHASWAVVSAADPAAVMGAVSLHHIDLDQLDSEVGYWVAPAFRRRRVGARALRAAAQFGFDALGLHRVHLYHAIENVGSCRVAETAGFPYEGTHRESYRFADGNWHNEHSHARLASD